MLPSTVFRNTHVCGQHQDYLRILKSLRILDSEKLHDSIKPHHP